MRRYAQTSGVLASQTLSVPTLTQAVVEQIYSYGLDLLLDQRRYLSWKSVLPQSDFVRLRGFGIVNLNSRTTWYDLSTIAKLRPPHIKASASPAKADL